MNFLQKLLKCALIVNFVIVNIKATSSKPDYILDNVKHVPKPHHDQLQHQQQRRTDFITNVPRSESKISDSERVVIDFKDSKLSPPLMIWPETLISQESNNHTNFNYYKVLPTSKDPIIGGTRKFIEYYTREDQGGNDIPLNRKPKILINENPEFYTTNENEVGSSTVARDHKKLPIIIVESNNNDEHKDFTLTSSSTSDFLNIDSKTIHITPNDKILNSRNIVNQDESFLNTLESFSGEKDKSKKMANVVRSVIPEKFLTPVHVGIVLMNENEVANLPRKNPTKQQQQHFTLKSHEPFMPVVGVDTLRKNNNENSAFIPSELMSQTVLPTMLMGNPITIATGGKRPANFIDSISLTNPPKTQQKQSTATSFLSELFNFDEIINLLTGKKSTQQQSTQNQQQQQQQQQQNYNKISPSSSNINAIKKPLHSKYFPSLNRPNRMPKYMTIPLAEYQKHQDHFRYMPDQMTAASQQSTRTLNEFADPYSKYNHHDIYVGPTPSSEDYWAMNGVSFNDGIKFRRNVENGRSLRIEYGGFLPKISPSLEIDQNGAPIHKTTN